MKPDLTVILPFIHKMAYQHARARNRIPRMSKLEPEDIAHEYVAHLLSKIDQFDPERGKLITWAARCIWNLHYWFLKQEIEQPKTRVSCVFSGFGSTSGGGVLGTWGTHKFDPVRANIRRERREIVRDAIETFGRKEAALLRKVVLQEKPCSEASRELKRGRDWGKRHFNKLLPLLEQRILDRLSSGCGAF